MRMEVVAFLVALAALSAVPSLAQETRYCRYADLSIWSGWRVIYIHYSRNEGQSCKDALAVLLTKVNKQGVADQITDKTYYTGGSIQNPGPVACVDKDANQCIFAFTTSVLWHPDKYFIDQCGYDLLDATNSAGSCEAVKDLLGV